MEPNGRGSSPGPRAQDRTDERGHHCPLYRKEHIRRSTLAPILSSRPRNERAYIRIEHSPSAIEEEKFSRASICDGQRSYRLDRGEKLPAAANIIRHRLTREARPGNAFKCALIPIYYAGPK